MSSYPSQGIFIGGTDTNVGKTYVGGLLAGTLVRQRMRVGVYKPVASGCFLQHHELVADDAVRLWEAAGRPVDLNRVCPQRFEAPLAPHAAAAMEGKAVDEDLLKDGLAYWTDQCEIVIVEGAGGLLSPVSTNLCVADLALEFGYPVVIIARNSLGVINQTLQTLLTAQHYGSGLTISGVILNDQHSGRDDPSIETNWDDLKRRCDVPVLDHVKLGAKQLSRQVDWLALAGPPRRC